MLKRSRMERGDGINATGIYGICVGGSDKSESFFLRQDTTKGRIKFTSEKIYSIFKRIVAVVVKKIQKLDPQFPRL